MPAFLASLNAAYPWLGVHIAGLQRAGAPIFPFLFSHALFSLVAFVLYDCIETTLTPLVLGWKSFPSAVGPLLWTLFGLTEAFSFVFLRSVRAISFFPRAVALGFCVWAWYYMSVPYGFSSEAACVLGAVYLHLGLLTLWFMELPALAARKVSEARPREIMLQLGAREPVGPGFSFGARIPGLWTLLHPLQMLEPIAPDGGEGQGGGAGGQDMPRPLGPAARQQAAASAAAAASPDSVSLALGGSSSGEHDRGEPLLGTAASEGEGEGEGEGAGHRPMFQGVTAGVGRLANAVRR